MERPGPPPEVPGPAGPPAPPPGLLAPWPIGSRLARNRVLFGPLATNLADGRAIGAAHVAFYRRRAEGGAGVVVTEEASVHDADWPYERAPLAARCGEGWRAVAAACRDAGALAVAALGHSGAEGSSLWSRCPLWSPSGVAGPGGAEAPLVMDDEQTVEVVDAFATAAALALDAGMAGVEVNAGGHSLVRQFCSGLTNRRDGRWAAPGGPFALAVVRAVRAAAGDAIVGVRLCVDELAPWAGITPDDGVRLAVALAPHVDYLVVVRGSGLAPDALRPDGHEPPGFNRAATASVSAAVSAAVGGACAVVWQGSVVDPAAAAAAVDDGTCAAVEMTRAQLADPALVAKVASGRAGTVRPCLLCNQACRVRTEPGLVISCVVEPSVGHEADEPAEPGGGPAGAPRLGALLVVGAGPAGLEAARVAAGAGWDVTVAERSGRTGGMLRVAASSPGRGRLAALAAWQLAECRRLGVSIHLGRCVTAEEVAAWDGPVVIATGSRPRPPAFAVEAGASVLDAPGGLAAASSAPGGGDGVEGPVAVWDPVGGAVGVSVCEALAAPGRAITLLTPDPVAGALLDVTGDLVAANGRLARAGVRVLTRVALRSVRPGSVEVADRFGPATRVVPAAVVVDAGPRLAEDRLWLRAVAAAPLAPLARAGDAVAPRTVAEAVREGRAAARAVSP